MVEKGDGIRWLILRSLQVHMQFMDWALLMATYAREYRPVQLSARSETLDSRFRNQHTSHHKWKPQHKQLFPSRSRSSKYRQFTVAEMCAIQCRSYVTSSKLYTRTRCRFMQAQLIHARLNCHAQLPSYDDRAIYQRGHVDQYCHLVQVHPMAAALEPSLLFGFSLSSSLGRSILVDRYRCL